MRASSVAPGPFDNSRVSCVSVCVCMCGCVCVSALTCQLRNACKKNTALETPFTRCTNKKSSH